MRKDGFTDSLPIRFSLGEVRLDRIGTDTAYDTVYGRNLKRMKARRKKTTKPSLSYQCKKDWHSSCTKKSCNCNCGHITL